MRFGDGLCFVKFGTPRMRFFVGRLKAIGRAVVLALRGGLPLPTMQRIRFVPPRGHIDQTGRIWHIKLAYRQREVPPFNGQTAFCVDLFGDAFKSFPTKGGIRACVKERQIKVGSEKGYAHPFCKSSKRHIPAADARSKQTAHAGANL